MRAVDIQHDGNYSKESIIKRLGILIAAEPEASAILKDSFYRWEKAADKQFHSQKFPVSLMLSGVGKVFASYALMRLSDSCDAFLSLGTSAALSKHAVGDLVFSTEFVEHDMDVSPIGVPPGVTPFSAMKNAVIQPDSFNLAKRALDTLVEEGINYSLGRSMSGDQFLSDPEAARKKAELFGASLADMESAALAKLCALKLCKPFSAVRYISDSADEDSSSMWQQEVRKAGKLLNTVVRQCVLINS